jgi:stalled ribosome rescue protein Dom34
MKTEKKIGVYLDHSEAQFVNYQTDSENLKSIESDFNHFEKEKTLSKSENLMHNKEQHELSTFFKKIGQAILNFDDVLLFGPTDAKVELFNYLREDHKFDKVKMQVKTTDKLSENYQNEFVKDHFDKLLNFK